jgi:hypothetical protein
MIVDEKEKTVEERNIDQAVLCYVCVSESKKSESRENSESRDRISS